MIAVEPPALVSETPTKHKKSENTPKKRLHILVWVCLLTACLGTNWFAYQYFLIPQPRSYTPAWHGAQWIQAQQHTSPVAYFSYGFNLTKLPQGAFVIMAASQSFHFYVNGTAVGANNNDLTKMPHAYMYDVLSLLRQGPNKLAVRVDNLDDQTPMLKLSLGIVLGQITIYHGTGVDSWKATSQSSLVYSHKGINGFTWTRPTFITTAWQLAQPIVQFPMNPTLSVNPELYEKPSPATWISGGVNSDAYFLRQVDVPSNTTNAWLRLASTGVMHVYINGKLYIIKAFLPTTKDGQIAYFQDNGATVSNTNTVSLGTYDISPYVHPGLNTIAVHVSSSGINGYQDGLTTTNAALSVDMLMTDATATHDEWIGTGGWHVSSTATPDWAQGSNATLAWPSPITIRQPAPIVNVYMSNTVVPNATQVLPSTSVVETALLSILAVLLAWLVLSLPLLYLYRGVRAFELTSLVFLPALACEAVLIALSHEPQIARPFPYTNFWLFTLLAIVGISYCLLLLHVLHENKKLSLHIRNAKQYVKKFYAANIHWQQQRLPRFLKFTTSWLAIHWLFVLIVLLAIPLIFYNLSYEPYWQDELTSYLVAKSILKTGLPYLPSGFLYPKSELFSYILALVMAVFGDQPGTVRAISATEYVLCLPLIYYVGNYFFERRVATLATAMLAFSPLALNWGRQVRMYEQAQLLTLLTLFLFYKAIEKPQRPRYVYLAVASLVVCYFSHEETFITMPALVVCVLMTSRNKTRLLPSVLSNKHWWLASAIGVGIIGTQLLVVNLSHPLLIGTDPSQRPPIQFTTDNVSYYYTLLFVPSNASNIAMDSYLALAGCILGVYSGDRRIRYCAVFFVVSFIMLVFALTLQADRYFYPLLTIYELLGAYAIIRLFSVLQRFVSSFGRREHRDRAEEGQLSFSIRTAFPVKVLLHATLSIMCVAVLVTPMLPFTTYNLFVSRSTGLPYYHKYIQYNDAASYIDQHWKPGDIVISIVPDHVVAYYIGHIDYFIMEDHALFLFEKNGHIVDTYTGKIGLFRQSDLQAVLAAHTRVWIISGNNMYQTNAFRRLKLPPDFHIAYEGPVSIIYCRGE